jgi:D-glycero-alpha-D-manno-heptose-7-phosphate kinase
MRRHDERHVLEYRSAKRLELHGTETIRRMFDDRQLQMRVGDRIPVAGEVLSAGGHALSLQPPDDGACEPRHVGGVFAERAVPDDGISGIGVDVEDRRVIERDPDGGDLPSERAPEPLRQRLGRGPPEDRHRGPSRERLLQPCHPPAFLIDAHPRRHLAPERLDFASEFGHLFREFDVTAEENRTADVELARERPPFGRNRRGGKTSDEELTNLPGGSWRHSVQNYNVHVQITASAPTRIDLAGGTLDIWPLYLFHPGAQTVNVAISLRAHVHVQAREDDRIEIVSEDTDRRVVAASAAALRQDETLPLLGLIACAFAAKGVTIRTRGESPAGAGIAGSSALNVAVCAALARWTGSMDDPESLLATAMNVEAQAIKVPTGLQDYRPALYGGIAAMELGVHGVTRVSLTVDPEELQRRLVLCYTGAPRNSGTNNWEIMKRHIDGDRHVFDCFERIRDTAASMREALERGDWAATARHVAAEWANRRRLAPGVSTPLIDDLTARGMAAGAEAAKVCGAGGGGCLFFLAPPDRTDAVREAIAAGGARLLQFSIETAGLRLEMAR